MGNPFEIGKMNMFYPAQQIGGINAIGGGQAGSGRTGAVNRGSAIDRELADFQRFLPNNNGTGELRPMNAEANAKLPFLYA